MKELVLDPLPSWERREGMIMAWLHTLRVMRRVWIPLDLLRGRLQRHAIDLSPTDYMGYWIDYRCQRKQAGLPACSSAMLSYLEWRERVADLHERTTLLALFGEDLDPRCAEHRRILLLRDGATPVDELPYAPADPERRIGRIAAYQEMVRFLDDETAGLTVKEAFVKFWMHTQDGIMAVMPDAFWQYRQRVWCRACRAGRDPEERLLLAPYDPWRKLVAAAAAEDAHCRQAGQPPSARYASLRRDLLLRQDEPLPYTV